MGEDKSGKKESRPVLGEITNQVAKRGLNLVSSSPNKPSPKSLIGSKRSGGDPSNSDDDDSRFWKQVSKVVENLEKERYVSPKRPKIVSESGLSPLSGGKTYRLRTSSSRSSPVQGKPVFIPDHVVKVPSLGSVVGRLDLGRARTIPNVVANAAVLDEGVKEGVPIANVTVAEVEGVKESQGEETVVVSDSGENYCTQESLATKVVMEETKVVDVDYLPSSQSESVANSRFVDVKDKGLYGLERCALLKGDVSASSGAGIELLKSCSCSFCTKAAYIWSDLHYQDVKGRISVARKSQKEANNLAQRYAGENQRVSHGQQHSHRDANLENNLTNQWKSLFHQMEDTFAGESSQLQTYLNSLKDLRETFKNTGSISGSSDAQQCSSDASDRVD